MRRKPCQVRQGQGKPELVLGLEMEHTSRLVTSTLR